MGIFYNAKRKYAVVNDDLGAYFPNTWFETEEEALREAKLRANILPDNLSVYIYTGTHKVQKRQEPIDVTVYDLNK